MNSYFVRCNFIMNDILITSLISHLLDIIFLHILITRVKILLHSFFQFYNEGLSNNFKKIYSVGILWGVKGKRRGTGTEKFAKSLNHHMDKEHSSHWIWRCQIIMFCPLEMRRFVDLLRIERSNMCFHAKSEDKGNGTAQWILKHYSGWCGKKIVLKLLVCSICVFYIYTCFE